MIRNRWYPVLEGAALTHGRRSRPVTIQRFGRRWVAWRDDAARAIVFPAHCPHRGADLGMGKVVSSDQGRVLACPWHGFQFDALGACRAMPCEGPEAPAPAGLRTTAQPVQESHGLIWMWWGDARPEYPALPWFDDVSLDLSRSAQASRVLPYHYSRIAETNLDIHHTPFVHGSVMPGLGKRIVNFSASADGDRIVTRGQLSRHDGSRAMSFRADVILPALSLIELSPRLRLVVAATPVDDDHSWLWFRYHHDYTGLPVIRRLISWIAVQLELRIVQQQDWRIFSRWAPGSADDVRYHLVDADRGIALYRRRRREILDAQTTGREASTVEHHAIG